MDFKGLTDNQWLDALSGDLAITGIPSLPSKEIQLRFTGTSGKDTLTQAYGFYLLVKRYLPKTTNGKEKLLDFGCGWGRITRFWLKVFAA